METMAGSSSVSILIVEDDEDVLELLARIVTRKFSGLKLHTATNGRAGLELFGSHLPDIVITDINMPEMGGGQMADKIRTIKPDTRFIILSGDSEVLGDQISGRKGAGFNQYIMKPVLFGILFAAIERCLAEIRQQYSR
jgi:YesN/AraC family two-component response regulator